MDNKPYVSTSIKRMRRKVQGGQDTQQFKDDVMEASNLGVEDFLERLKTGQVKIETTADFERMVKLGLLVHGEPTERVEESTNVADIIEMETISDSDEFHKVVDMLSGSLGDKNQSEHE